MKLVEGIDDPQLKLRTVLTQLVRLATRAGAPWASASCCAR
jgi:hypothetical protein